MKNEGFLYFNQQEVDDGVTEHARERRLRTFVRNVYQYHRQKIYEVLMHHYSDWERPSDPTIIRCVPSPNLSFFLSEYDYTAACNLKTNLCLHGNGG